MKYRIQCESTDTGDSVPLVNSAPWTVPVVSPSCILTYHEIVRDKAVYLYSVSSQQLDEHLRFFGALNRTSRPAIPRPHVTFDDGHLSAYERGVPLLRKHAIPAIFFVTAGFIGVRKDFMTWAQLKEIVAEGHDVQSHGWSHNFLTHCSPLQLEQELCRSKRVIEDRLGIPVEALSVPGGRWNRRVLEACAEAGYQRVYVSDPWIQSQQQNGVVLHGRLMVTRSTNVQQLERWCTMSGASLLLLRAQNLAKQAVRLVLGDRRYLALWCALSRYDEGKNF